MKGAFLLIGLISGWRLAFGSVYICKEPDDGRRAAAIAGRQPHILTQQYAVFYRAGLFFDGLRTTLIGKTILYFSNINWATAMPGRKR